MEEYFYKEIKNRIDLISNYQSETGIYEIDPSAIDKKVKELVLLSKDIENLKASVNMANAYFSELYEKLDPVEIEFKKLSTEMDVNEIAYFLHQNELDLFNRFIFNHPGIPLSLNSVK